MSGLAALFTRDGRPADERLLWSMLHAAPHRGPDGMSVCGFGRAALGYAACAVTAEELDERQPLLSTQSGCAIIADARLDNRAELIARLPAASPRQSDAALLLALYEAHGLAMLPWLLGDFALVIWDPREQALVCARDTSGQRDLFYRLDQRSFAAASEIWQLFQDPRASIEPNEDRIRDYLVPLNMERNEKQSSETFYQGIRSVEAGHVLIIDTHGLRDRAYWRLEPQAEIRYRREEEYAEHFRDLLFKAVKARLRSAAPLGAMLSGGLDSSSVVCAALTMRRSESTPVQPLNAFSLVFDGEVHDERRYIEEIEATYDVAVRYIRPNSYAGRLQLEPDVFLQAPSDALPSMYNQLYAEAARIGTRVLLTGEVADAYVRGSPFVLDRLLRQGRFGDARRNYRTIRALSNLSRLEIGLLGCVAPLLPISAQVAVTNRYSAQLERRGRGRLAPLWMAPALRQQIEQRHWELTRKIDHDRRFADPTREQDYRLLYQPEVGIRAPSLPLQFARPYADRRLHAFMLAIPSEVKFLPAGDTTTLYGSEKRVVRCAMRGIVPESIRSRTNKTVFDAVRDHEVEEQFPRLRAIFGPGGRSTIAQRGYIDAERFWDRLQRLHAGEGGADYGYITALLNLETWFRSVDVARCRLRQQRLREGQLGDERLPDVRAVVTADSP
jgi:asparagine synthase (glutamine-hydrolysing)